MDDNTTLILKIVEKTQKDITDIYEKLDGMFDIKNKVNEIERKVDEIERRLSCTENTKNDIYKDVIKKSIWAVIVFFTGALGIGITEIIIKLKGG